eukprot:TRINITY_DN30501_c0_g1_i1.p1 TRINITY_DN30501_c0_g1~~TRINITY_DN30501_c0_g1_i1.p1  ORF type:complete len:359 (+),score=78.27 TRINITY_DN30501_c0_g1_i1:69-1079(+)
MASLGLAAAASQKKVLGESVLRFGVIADVQYADVPDAFNFSRTSFRRYRGALVGLRRAIDEWTSDRLSFVVDLGDMIDQQCEANGDTDVAMKRILAEWDRLSVPHHHLIGNHELYNYTRDELRAAVPNVAPFYRSFRPQPGEWRVIIVDAYELSMCEKGGDYNAAIEYLSQHNKNDLRAPRGTVNVLEGMKGLERRFNPMGGAMKTEQLRWLREELRDAVRCGERAVICGHLPVHPGSCTPAALQWNHTDVLDVIESVPKGVVPLFLAGHFHGGGYAFEERTGTHHVTLPSPLGGSEEDPRAHCTVTLSPTCASIEGRGLVRSRELPLVRTQAAML